MRVGKGGGASRREALLAFTAFALVGISPGLAQQTGGIIVVSRERILRESDVARQLRQAELTLTAQLQANVDAAKAALDAEEVELTKLRAELSASEFEERAAEFDRRIRLVRREAQERASALQRGFQEARAVLVAALPPVLERLRVETGAMVVLSAEQVLALGEGVDMTDRAIELFNAEGGSIEIPGIDTTTPILPDPDENAPQQTEGQ